METNLSGVYVEPLKLFPFQFGGGMNDNDRSSSGSYSRASSQEDGTDKRHALRTMEDNLRQRDLMLGYEKQMMGLAAAAAIKNGQDPSTALNSYFTYLLSNKSKKETYTADWNRAQQMDMDLREFNKDVAIKQVGESRVFRQIGDVRVPVTNPYSGQDLTYGTFGNLAHSLSWSEDPNVYGRVPKIENGKVVGYNDWTQGIPSVYEKDAYETYANTNVDRYKGSIMSTAGGGTDLKNVTTLAMHLMIPTSQWSKSSNVRAMNELADGFMLSMPDQAKNRLWDDFYNAGQRGERIFVEHDVKDGKKTKTVKESSEIIDRAHINRILESQQDAIANGDKDRYNQLEENKLTYLSSAFKRYANARMMAKISPAISISQSGSTTYATGPDLSGIGGNKDQLNSFFDAVRSGQAMEFGMLAGERIKRGYKDASGQDIVTNDPSQPLVNQDPIFQKSYQTGLQALYTETGVNGSRYFPWSITPADAKAVNKSIFDSFIRKFPEAKDVMLGTETKNRDVIQKLYQNYKADMYDRYLYDQLSPEWKEVMIPGSTQRHITVSNKVPFATGYNPAGLGLNYLNQTGDQANGQYNPTYEQVTGGGIRRSAAYARTFPTIIFPKGAYEQTSLYAQPLNATNQIMIGDTWYNVEDLMRNSENSQRPVVMEYTGLLPYYPDAQNNLQTMGDAFVSLTPQQMEYVSVTVGGKKLTLADLSDDEKKQMGIQAINLSEKGAKDEMRKDVVEGLNAGGYSGTIYKVPATINFNANFNYDYRFGVPKKAGNLQPKKLAGNPRRIEPQAGNGCF